MIIEYLSYIGLGAIAGFVAGLLGVGGGLIIVPVLILLFQANNFSAEIIVHMAIGTSLASIVFTSISSVYAHHYRHHAVQWRIVKKLTPGIIIGAAAGAIIANMVAAKNLQMFFAIFELTIALQMALNIKAHASRTLPRTAGMTLVGSGIGSLSAIVGIGGGTLTVPFLSWCNVKMQQAVATSSACGLPIAVAGCIGFMITGWDVSLLPVDAVGYIYWPALLAISFSSILFAPLGAKVAHYISPQKLRRIFSIVLFLLGVKMLLG